MSSPNFLTITDTVLSHNWCIQPYDFISIMLAEHPLKGSLVHISSNIWLENHWVEGQIIEMIRLFCHHLPQRRFKDHLVVDLPSAFRATVALSEKLLQKSVEGFAKTGFKQSLDCLQRSLKASFGL